MKGYPAGGPCSGGWSPAGPYGGWCPAGAPCSGGWCPAGGPCGSPAGGPCGGSPEPGGGGREITFIYLPCP